MDPSDASTIPEDIRIDNPAIINRRDIVFLTSLMILQDREIILPKLEPEQISTYDLKYEYIVSPI